MSMTAGADTAERERLLATRRASWGPFVAGLVVYIGFIVAGFFLNLRSLNTLGGVGLLFVGSLGNYHRVFTLRRDAPARWALAAIGALFVSHVVNFGTADISLTLKYSLVFVLFVQVFSWRLPRLSESAWRGQLLALCLVPLVLSVAWGDYFVLSDERRLSGIFANPNNLALVGFVPLFFVHDKDSTRRKLFVHGLIVAVLVLTNTVGALVAYAVGLAYRARKRISVSRQVLWIAIAAGITVIAVVTGAFGISERLVRQYEVIRLNLETAISTQDFQFGALADEYGASSLSGIWRIVMWTKILAATARATPDVWLFGRGIGSSREVFGNLPHNEYVRILAEMGILTLAAFVGFFVTAWKRLTETDRHVLLIFFVYCITENNLDNFLFMALLMFFLGSGVRDRNLHARNMSQMSPPLFAR